MSSASRSVGRPVSRSVLAGQLNNLASIIKSIFATGEQGFAYDPNDLTTLFQDAAGTIPVTAAGQPVGLMRDKSGRNNHASQTVSASRPILQRNATTGAYYLEFDGVDDSLQTNSIDFTMTDKVSLFVGVRKLSDAATGTVFEVGDGVVSTSFGLLAPSVSGANKFDARVSPGYVGSTTKDTAFNAPVSAVVVMLGTRASGGVSSQLRVNAVAQPPFQIISTPPTFMNGNLYIGRRGGTSFPFNGHLYSLIGIGRLAINSETIALEKSIAKNTGVTLNV